MTLCIRMEVIVDSSSIADRYISRGGGSPNPSATDVATDIVDLASFLLWHEENDLHGGVRARDAFLSMCRLLNVEPHKIRQIIRPEG